MLILIYLLVGALAGLLAGLFGIGGGIVIVPILTITFQVLKFSPEVLTHMAIATSLATIAFTSISSVRGHHLKNAVDWPLVARLSIGILFGAVMGAITAESLSGKDLQVAIGIFALMVAVHMGLGLEPRSVRSLPSSKVMVASGGIIGWASALFGIGGGAITVPFLTWFNHPIQRSVATAAACGFPIAVVGAFSNLVTGWGNLDLPQNSAGYIYLPALAGIVVTSVPFARVGANLAHKLPANILRKLFALLLVLVAIKFLSVNL
jgi:uncharacterized membrane protein YfcA